MKVFKIYPERQFSKECLNHQLFSDFLIKSLPLGYEVKYKNFRKCVNVKIFFELSPWFQVKRNLIRSLLIKIQAVSIFLLLKTGKFRASLENRLTAHAKAWAALITWCGHTSASGAWKCQFHAFFMH